jgi:L-lactate dehydrogenase complex protein LldG
MVEGTLMNDSRQIILKRIQSALRSEGDSRVPLPLVARNYHMQSHFSDEERLNLFVERVSDYKATVTRVEEDDLAIAIGCICATERVTKLLVPSGLENRWLPQADSGVAVTVDEGQSCSVDEIDQNDAVLTGCFRAVAQTGTIVMTEGAGQGRRILTLLPDIHICVVRTNQIVGIIPEVFADLDPIIKERKTPVTFISGPSATSDIELDRVEGVHGPRRLHVVII